MIFHRNFFVVLQKFIFILKALRVYIYRLKKNLRMSKKPYQRPSKFSQFVKLYIKV
jgi:hypothetical protein